MPRLDLSAADFAQMLTDEGPTGDAWPTEADTVRQQGILALMGTMKRLNDRANYLITDAFPADSTELLPDWENSLGLPDPCAGLDPTIEQRRNQVVARLTYRGGQSLPYLVGFAAALGFPITIEQFAPARAGSLVAGGPLNGPDWAFVWRVHAPAVTVTRFAAGVSHAGEPLSAFGSAVLECELRRIARASRILQIAYGD